MWRNYLIIAWRCLVRDGTTSVVNVAGLTLAIACALLAALFIRHELTYDQFHENGDRIFRLALADSGSAYASAGHPTNASSAMRDAFPEIERIARVTIAGYTDARADGAEPVEVDALLVDPDFLRMFSFPEMAGRGPEALTDPQSVVLTESAARRLFDGEALGRVVTLRAAQLDGEPRDMIVGAVLEDPPAASSLRFECLIGLGPEAAGEPIPVYTDGVPAYVQLAQGARAEDVEVKLTSWLTERWNRFRQRKMVAGLQPLRDIHLNSNIEGGLSPASRLLYSYILAGIALAVVCIACINYTNTAVARSLARSGEIGVRKVLGAARSQLARQFASEAVLATAASFILALGVASLLLPAFAGVAQRDLDLSDLWSWSGAIATLCVFAVASAGAAVYPAVILSRIRPVAAFNQEFRPTGGGLIQRALIITQFALSAGLVTAAILMTAQMQMMRDHDLGFRGEQIVIARDPEPFKLGNREEWKAYIRRMTLLVETVGRIPGVVSASGTHLDADGSPGQYDLALSPADTIDVRCLEVTHNFIETLGLQMIAGRGLTPGDADAAIINETLARQLGSEALGQPLATRVFRSDHRYLSPTVIGIVKDFHFRSLHHPIEPFVLVPRPPISDHPYFNTATIRIAPQNVATTLEQIRDTWRELGTDRELQLQFLDAEFDALYRAEERWLAIVRAAAAVAIGVACLGAFSLTALAAARRRKEIGVRKVVGATTRQVVAVFTGEFARLVVPGCLVAVPLSYLALDRWLQEFAYRVEPSLIHFATAGAVVIALVLAVVASQAMRAGLANPTDLLRHE